MSAIEDLHSAAELLESIHSGNFDDLRPYLTEATATAKRAIEEHHAEVADLTRRLGAATNKIEDLRDEVDELETDAWADDGKCDDCATAERDLAAAEQRARDLHYARPDGYRLVCDHCATLWPCATADALEVSAL